MKHVILAILYSSFVFFAKSQQKQLSNDEVIIHLNLFDFDGKPIQTRAYFHNPRTNKTIKAQTNSDGKGILRLQSGERYMAKIDVSDDSYEYELPLFSESPTELDLRFHVTSTVTQSDKNAKATIMLLGLSDKKNQLQLTDENRTLVKEKHNDSIWTFEINKYGNYTLLINGAAIKNNHLNISDKENNFHYALIFHSDTSAELQPLIPGKSYVFIQLSNFEGIPAEAGAQVILRSVCNENYTQLKLGEGGVLLTEIPNDGNYVIMAPHHSGMGNFRATKAPGEINISTSYLTSGSALQQMPDIRESLIQLGEFDKHLIIDTTDRVTTAIMNALPQLGPLDGSFINRLENKEYVGDIPDTVSVYRKYRFEVLSVLNRKKNKWRERITVADVRLSVYEGLKQLIYWRETENKERRLSGFVFCGKKDRFVEPLFGKSIRDTLMEAFEEYKDESGKPAPLLRSVLSGIKKFGLGKDVIMVCDAGLPVSDMEKLSAIKSPVRVVFVNSTITPIHPHYFEIAQKTGGSLHTNTEDLYSLDKIPEGKQIVLSKNRYQKVNGRFEIVCSTIGK